MVYPLHLFPFTWRTTKSAYVLSLGCIPPLNELLNINDTVIIQPNRNINYDLVANKRIVIKETEGASAEYTFSSETDSKELHHIEFDSFACKEYVLHEVNSFISSANVEKSKPIVFGISGGGDSNTLIEAFIKSQKIEKDQIIAVMCLGLPTWDSAKERAMALCNRFGIKLHFVLPEDICKLLGKRPASDWFSGFDEVFNDSEMAEILGTLVVRLALQQKARELNAQAVVIGLNLEDLLAESYLRLMQGRLPLPFPIRVIDDVSIMYPLYRIPKKLLDGCHPKYSLENYQQRVSDRIQGRAVVYHLAQYLNSIIPSSEFDMIDGLRKLSLLNRDFCHFDEDLGFSVTEELPKVLKDKWKYFTAY